MRETTSHVIRSFTYVLVLILIQILNCLFTTESILFHELCCNFFRGDAETPAGILLR